MPSPALARPWRALEVQDGACRVQAELRSLSTVWVRVTGTLCDAGAGQLLPRLREALERKKERVVLDLAHLSELEGAAAQRIAEGLRAYGSRIRVVLPQTREVTALAALLTLLRP